MFERFTDHARRVVVLAQEEARALRHGYIGTEHILLGLIHEDTGVAGAALNALGVNLPGAREQVAAIVSRGQDDPSGHIPFTPRAKKVLELSLREAMNLGHNYIGPEHILLGLIREGEGVANHVLQNLGVGGDQARETVLSLIGEQGEGEAGGKGGEGEPGGEGRAGVEWEVGGGLTRLPPDVRLVGHPAQLQEIIRRLGAIDGRLAAIERHLGIAPGEPAPPAEAAGPGDEAPPEAG